MNNNTYTSLGLAARIWLHTTLVLLIGVIAISVFFDTDGWQIPWVFLAAFVALFASLPALIVLAISISLINRPSWSTRFKFGLLFWITLFITLSYGCVAGIIDRDLSTIFLGTAILFTPASIAIIINANKLAVYFNDHLTTQINTQMELNTLPPQETNNNATHSNKVLIKGLITGVLILVMLIPTLFVTNLVEEREQRQKEVVAEVSSKWAGAQRITGPYIVLPYSDTYTGTNNVQVKTLRNLILLPEDLNVDGALTPENRKRSIYNVLTYRSNVNVNGSFQTQLTKDIDPSTIQWSDAKLCVGISDFKGIEEKITVIFNGVGYDLTPGLPIKEIDSTGLSAAIPLDASTVATKKNFSFSIKLKGSQQLQFIPLSANSKFALRSSWANPSFDGNVIPNKRDVNEKGFAAQWQFNQANLPFSTVVREGSLKASSLAFGVSMVQPADQYAKTMRSVKYAILFIGLTFALFFIVELMQHKPVHPVQYVLVGLALVIFYTLLLSISEFIAFDLAYLVAATATILLITFYAKGHFQNWKVASVFAAVLSCLYAFIFVLIRLEDTALLVGSIGLFSVLALVMYASRKINWYRPSVKPQTI